MLGVVGVTSNACTNLRMGLEKLRATGQAAPPSIVDLAKTFGPSHGSAWPEDVTVCDVGEDPLTGCRSYMILNDKTGAPPAQASFYSKMSQGSSSDGVKPEIGTTCLVLGAGKFAKQYMPLLNDDSIDVTVYMHCAGNHPFLAIVDVFYHTFVEGSVCILKHHPIQAGSKPYIDYIFEPLIRDGYLISTDAPLPVARSLCYAESLDKVWLGCACLPACYVDATKVALLS